MAKLFHGSLWSGPEESERSQAARRLRASLIERLGMAPETHCKAYPETTAELAKWLRDQATND